MDNINSTDTSRTMGEESSMRGISIDYSVPINEVKNKVLEFSKYLNSIGRLSLLHCDRSQYEEFVCLLLNLKKDIKYTLSELGRSCKKKKYEYVCCECNERIDIDPEKNFWDCLQSHEHFEYLYNKFLSEGLDGITENMENMSINHDIYMNPIAGPSNFESANENTDSGIDNEICEEKYDERYYKEGANTFRFNFDLKYDDAIQKKIYPESYVKAVRKIDRIREYPIQKTGPFRVVCLLCSCDLVTKNRIFKTNVEDHVMGQRHMRCAGNSENIENLKKYHEFWINVEVLHQAHQVYFKPVSSASLRCYLCNAVVKYDEVLPHIQTKSHKNQVLAMFEKKSNTFYLLDLQVQIYAVYKLKQVEVKNKEVKKEKVTVKTKVKPDKNDSDSSPSDNREVKHNIIKAVENSTSKNVLDLIPNRFKDHLKFFKNNGNAISCTLCKISFPQDVLIIKKHLKQASHISGCNIKYINYNYYCEICNVKFVDEATWDTHFIDGPNRHANMAESRKNKTTEYECTKCMTVIYGDDLSLTRHLSVNSKRNKKGSKETKLPKPITNLLKSKEVIEVEAAKLAFEANDALKYNQLTKQCCLRLETALAGTFEGCKAYPFGSRISGLGDQYSDLDVFIDTGGMYLGNKNQDPLSQVKFVRAAAGVFSKMKEEFQDIIQIATARTPIVKLYHKPTEIDCDLSFRHALSVENTKFLRFCLDLQPITQPFILMLKKWSQHNNFTEHISTYALALMAIFFLQVNSNLLSVKKLRELNPKKSLVIYGWETINYTMPLEKVKTCVLPYPHTISRLLRDFFAYYAKFKYSTEVVCPLLGYTVQKQQFVEEDLPNEMRSYVIQLQTEDPEEFRARSLMCIQDPFDLSHNLTKACQSGTVNKFKTLCELTCKHLDTFV